MARINTISVSYREYDTIMELDTDDQRLVEEAHKIAGNAYAPYSGFMVGAAVLLKSGMIITGSNVENAAFPSGICAERNAVSNYVSNFPDDQPVALAIAALTNGNLTDEFVSPCGNCRQVLAEEEARTGNKIRLILSGRNKTVVLDSIESLLPLQFNKKHFRPDHP
jgi:cytidine deaminase